MASNQDERQSHRNRPIGTSKRRAMVTRFMHLLAKELNHPTPVLSTGVRGAVVSLRLNISHISPEPLATRIEKPLPGVSSKYLNINGRDVGTIPNVDLLPYRLEIKKETESVNSARRIHELRKQNGYLLAEVALLKESRLALKDLQDWTQEAFWVLQAALQESSRRISASERRLMSYWGAHSGNGSEEMAAF